MVGWFLLGNEDNVNQFVMFAPKFANMFDVWGKIGIPIEKKLASLVTSYNFVNRIERITKSFSKTVQKEPTVSPGLQSTQ
jgi:hypothetical protein